VDEEERHPHAVNHAAIVGLGQVLQVGGGVKISATAKLVSTIAVGNTRPPTAGDENWGRCHQRAVRHALVLKNKIWSSARRPHRCRTDDVSIAANVAQSHGNTVGGVRRDRDGENQGPMLAAKTTWPAAW